MLEVLILRSTFTCAYIAMSLVLSLPLLHLLAYRMQDISCLSLNLAGSCHNDDCPKEGCPTTLHHGNCSKLIGGASATRPGGVGKP